MHKGIFQNKLTGTWFIDTKIKVMGSFKHCTIRRDDLGVPYATKRDADKDYDRAVNEWIKKNNIECHVMMLDDLMDKFIDWRRSTNEYGTCESDKSCYNLRIKPFFGNQPIVKCFNGENVQQFYSNLKNSTEWTNETKVKTIGKLKALLQFARQRRYITSDSYDDCISLLDIKPLRKLPNNSKHHDSVAWTNEEVDRMINAIDTSTKEGLMYRVFMFCGCRISEFLGLKAGDVNFDENRIYVDEQAVYEGEGKTVIKQKLKTKKSVRNFLMSKTIRDLLFNYITELGIKDDDYLFFPGCVYSKSSFRRHLYELEDKAKVRRNIPHGIRSTNTTNILEKCTTIDQIKAVANRNGHSVNTCLTYYQKIHEKTEKDILTFLEK